MKLCAQICHWIVSNRLPYNTNLNSSLDDDVTCSSSENSSSTRFFSGGRSNCCYSWSTQWPHFSTDTWQSLSLLSRTCINIRMHIIPKLQWVPSTRLHSSWWSSSTNKTEWLSFKHSNFNVPCPTVLCHRWRQSNSVTPSIPLTCIFQQHCTRVHCFHQVNQRSN